MTLSNLSHVASALGDYQTALDYAEKACSIMPQWEKVSIKIINIKKCPQFFFNIFTHYIWLDYFNSKKFTLIFLFKFYKSLSYSYLSGIFVYFLFLCVGGGGFISQLHLSFYITYIPVIINYYMYVNLLWINCI